KLIGRWHMIFLAWYEPLGALTPEDASAYTLYSKHFYSLLLPCLPKDFPSALKDLFTADLMKPAVLFIPSSHHFPHTPIQQLSALGLLSRFQPILFSVGYDAIDRRIETTCKGEWTQSSESSLEGMLNWFRKDIGLWLLKLLEAADGRLPQGSGKTARERVIELMKPAMSRFEYHIYKSLSELRIGELFDIIIEFPDTVPVLHDLRICLTKTDQRALLVKKLCESNSRRLLHPGADTQDIITQYISLIKALRLLDPPGVLLSCVAHPVRAYLSRSREDTIRCIVTSLVEPGHSLGDELDRTSNSNQNNQFSNSEFPLQEEGDYGSVSWLPDPVDAPAGYKDGLKDDVIESLVSIYETRDGFFKELQNLLASRLLNKTFEQAYKRQKVDRILRWKSQLGSVSIAVELEDRTLNLEVSTLQASVIELFSKSYKYTVEQLKKKLRLKSSKGMSLLRNTLYFWSNLEVLKEIEPGLWRLFETRKSFVASNARTSRHGERSISSMLLLFGREKEQVRRRGLLFFLPPSV
ncbi:anaphase-promoting complex subunit 2, partial [Phakopsora pachyrhizi]